MSLQEYQPHNEPQITYNSNQIFSLRLRIHINACLLICIFVLFSFLFFLSENKQILQYLTYVPERATCCQTVNIRDQGVYIELRIVESDALTEMCHQPFCYHLRQHVRFASQVAVLNLSVDVDVVKALCQSDPGPLKETQM